MSMIPNQAKTYVLDEAHTYSGDTSTESSAEDASRDDLRILISLLRADARFSK